MLGDLNTRSALDASCSKERSKVTRRGFACLSEEANGLALKQDQGIQKVECLAWVEGRGKRAGDGLGDLLNGGRSLGDRLQ